MFSLVKKLRETYAASTKDAFATPLLDPTQLQQLHQQAKTTPSFIFQRQKEQAQPLLGELASMYYGQGLEFEENRLYAQGDDPRFINWRLLARTGDLYSKIFRETRRPQLFVVMDRRPAMHFATRCQLKVTLAARVAAFMIYQSLARQHAVSGVVVDDEMHWFNSATTEISADALLQAIIAPSHPTPFADETCSMRQLLQHVQLQLKAGNNLLLLSDFHDLDADCETQLFNLARLHDVIAVHINDPAELALPSAVALPVADELTDNAVDIGVHDDTTRKAYIALHQSRQRQLQARLEQTGCHYVALRTDRDLEPLTAEQRNG